MVRVFKVATTSNGTIIYSVGSSLSSLFIAGTIIFSSLVMDNLKDYMGPHPDPPGTEDFVFWYVDDHFDGVVSMSTMTDPPPSQFPLEKHCVSFTLATNSAAWTTNNDNQNTINDNDAIALLTSADPPKMTMPPLALMMRCYCPWCSHSILSWSPTFKNMPPRKASCLQSTLNDPSPPRSSIISFLEKAITCLDRIQFKQQHKHKGVIFVALPNLMAISRVLNAVFLSHIFGMPAIEISWFALKDQTFPTTISYAPNWQLLTVEPLSIWRVYWPLMRLVPSKKSHNVESTSLRCVWILRSTFLIKASHHQCLIKWGFVSWKKILCWWP